jgi:hypothetical protein
MLVAAAIAGLTTAGTLAAAGSSLATWLQPAAVPLLAIGSLTTVADWIWPGLPRPFTFRRQVSLRRVTSPGWSRELVWGADVGIGATTVVQSWSIWAFLLLSFLMANPAVSLLAGGLFGAIRCGQPAVLCRRRPPRPWWEVRLSRHPRKTRAIITSCVVAALLVIAPLII